MQQKAYKSLCFRDKDKDVWRMGVHSRFNCYVTDGLTDECIKTALARLFRARS